MFGTKTLFIYDCHQNFFYYFSVKRLKFAQLVPCSSNPAMKTYWLDDLVAYV